MAQIDSLGTKKHLLFIEGQGLGGFGSINYQRIFYQNQPWNVGVRVGMSTNNLYDFNLDFNPDVILPVSFVAHYGGKHKLAMGIGKTISSIVVADQDDYSPTRKFKFHTTASLGYNYHTRYNVVYGVMIYPILIENKHLISQFGLFAGYKF